MPTRIRATSHHFFAGMVFLCAAGLFLFTALPRISGSMASLPLPIFTGEATSTESSYNWSGYTASGGEFSAVSATWTVPPAGSAGEPLSGDATWVGIGGMNSPDLLQVGTQALVEADGTAHYEAWFERLPEASRPLPVEVLPGDSVSVSLALVSPGLWHISFSNTTNGKRYAFDTRYDSSLSSAEWIQEMPSLANGHRERGATSFIPLDQFGTVAFSAAAAVKDGVAQTIAGAGGEPLSMSSRAGKSLALPSVLSADGAAFQVERIAQ